MRQLENKISCRCEVGYCFLEADAAWSRQNIAKSENGFWRDIALLHNLEAERLQKKDAWMDRLGVIGTFQVCCLRRLDCCLK